MEKTTRTAIKNNPLRYAGQSIDDEIIRIREESVIPYVFIIIFSMSLAGLEWFYWYNEIPRKPKSLTAFAIVVSVYSLYKLIGYKKHIDNLKLGRQGEQEVGGILEELQENGHRIFHDLLEDNFNLDHVIVSEHGIFAIETKKPSKPKKGRLEIIFNGNGIIVNGFNTGKTIINQATAQGRWLKDVIQKSTGKNYFVKSIIVYPGGFVISEKGSQKSNLRVLNPKNLKKYIESLPKVLSKQDMMMVSYHISRYVKANYR